MPFIEFLAPPKEKPVRDAVARIVTDALCAAFNVGPQAMTIYFIDVPASHYAHAGEMSGADAQRVFVKVHAYRRDAEARRDAAARLTAPLAEALGVPSSAIIIYFFDRDLDEVSHAGHLACDKPA